MKSFFVAAIIFLLMFFGVSHSKEKHHNLCELKNSHYDTMIGEEKIHLSNVSVMDNDESVRDMLRKIFTYRIERLTIEKNAQIEVCYRQ